METSENIITADTAIETKQETPEQPVQPKPEKPKQTFKCLVCGKSYSKKTSLFTHHKTHPEHCVHCGENRGSTVENIYEHNLKHINIRPFICKLCGDSFLRNQQFVEHEKSHDKPPEEPVIKESKYKCKACQSSYSNWKLFYKHQQESGHFNEKFLCEICGSEFHSNFLLSQHIRRLHKRTDETFPCSSCSKIFATKPNLDSHVKKIHQNDNRKFVCETCNNTFSSAPNLKQHIKTVHEVEKDYECQTCKKPFKAKNRLTRHEKEVHMGKNGNPEEVRMFNCDHCQKKYKRQWHQARHSQMKHENSNASTATTSSAGTPPTPEINGNIPNNNNYNYQQLQQVPQMPSQPIVQDLNHISPMQQQQQSVTIPPVANSWNQMAQHPIQQQQQQNHPIQQQSVQQNQHQSPQQLDQHAMYPATEMNDSTKNYNASQSVPQQTTVQNGEYMNYAVNEQYSSKFEQAQAPPTAVTGINPSPYDSWNPPPTAATSWDYNQQHHAQPMYHQPQAQPNDWYYDPNQHQTHGMYNNAYNNYKTDYNCLNQPPAPIQPNADPSLYNGGNYYYPQNPPPDPYVANTQHQMNHPQMDYQHSNYHQNYHNPM